MKETTCRQMTWRALAAIAMFLMAGCSDQSAEVSPPATGEPKATAAASGVIQNGNFHFAGRDPALRKRLGFLEELFDQDGTFLPAAGAGARR